MRENGTITILVNTANDESHVRILLPNPLMALQSEAQRVAREYPNWTSMVVTLTNPQARQSRQA